MNELKTSFNEIFLDEISRFESSVYAYNIFFCCDKHRFAQIAKAYGKVYGYGALNYMYNSFNSWKGGYVNPNLNTRVKIVTSTMLTYNNEEKFIEAYTQLARHLNKKFPKAVSVELIVETYKKILSEIDLFKLRDKYGIYSEDEILYYENFIKSIFKGYTKIIFGNIILDFQLFQKLYNELNTSFLSTKFNTYLFDIEIEVQISKIDKFKIEIDNDLVNWEEDVESQLSDDFSVSKVLEIINSTKTTQIDGLLSEVEIQNIKEIKNSAEKTNNSLSLKANMRTNSGFLAIDLKVLSRIEILVLWGRVLLFIILLSYTFYYLITIYKNYVLFLIALIFMSVILIKPVLNDLMNLMKNISRIIITR